MFGRKKNSGKTVEKPKRIFRISKRKKQPFRK
jgi:hypothetical protein